MCVRALTQPTNACFTTLTSGTQWFVLLALYVTGRSHFFTVSCTNTIPSEQPLSLATRTPCVPLEGDHGTYAAERLVRISPQVLSSSGGGKKDTAKAFEELTEILFDMRCGGCLLCAAVVQDITAEEDALKWRGDETWTIEPTMHPFNPPTHSLPLPAQDAASPVSLQSINDRMWGGSGRKNRSNADACKPRKGNHDCWRNQFT